MRLKVKTITNRAPAFLKEAYRNDDLLDLHNDERFINPGEKYLTWNAGLWRVMRMTPGKVGVYIGGSPILHRAIYLAAI